MPLCILEVVEVLLGAVLKVFEVPEVMRRVLCVLEAVNGRLCSLEVL